MTAAEELRYLRVNRKIPVKDMVAVVQQLYPRFDRFLLSRCEHGGECGATIPDDALKALYEAFAPDRLKAIQGRKGDRHKLTCKVMARLDSGIYEALQRRLRADGYATAQDWLTAMVAGYIKEGNQDENL